MALLVNARNLSWSFGSRPLFAGMSSTLAEGERISVHQREEWRWCFLPGAEDAAFPSTADQR